MVGTLRKPKKLAREDGPREAVPRVKEADLAPPSPTLLLTKQALRRGDTLVVWRLDRLGRSLRDLIDTITHLGSRGVGFRSLQENIDTTTSGGKLVFHVFGSMAEFERDIIRERTLAGLHAARKRGRSGGRPKALTSKEVQMLNNMAADNSCGHL